MLKTIDILLGVSVVMLIMSMAVTVLTQSVLGIFQSRGRNLRAGLSDLLQQIDPKLEREVVDRISSAVLIHPMVTGAMGRPGTTIHREELTKLLMDLAAGNAPPGLMAKMGKDARNLLAASLEKNGIKDPAGLLDNVRSLALHLEMAHPELASHERQAMALMREAQSQFVAKINGWFDQTMDRVTERFTHSTQLITTLIAVVVAITLQLDTIGLINRLSTDDKFRQTMVSEAMKQVNQSRPPAEAETGETPGKDTRGSDGNVDAGKGREKTAGNEKPAGSEEASGAPVSGGFVRLDEEQRAAIDLLVSNDIVRIPASFSQWKARWGFDILTADMAPTGTQGAHSAQKDAQVDDRAPEKDKTSRAAPTAQHGAQVDGRKPEKGRIKGATPSAQNGAQVVDQTPENGKSKSAGPAEVKVAAGDSRAVGNEAGKPVPNAKVPASADEVSLLGVLLSALLLSLGAPFWYNTLKNLVRLRSVVAGKDDAQRALRQGSQAEAPAAGRAPTAASALVGEKGIVT